MRFPARPSHRIALLLATYALLLGWQAWRVGVTMDEPSHLTAAYMYWQGQDVLFPSDTPPLMRMISGWIPLLTRAPLRRDTPNWKNQSSFDIGAEMLEAMDHRAAHRLIFFSRLPFLLFPLATVWLVWHWGRQLFSEATALVLAACEALEPTLLGHGALIKSDVASAFGCLLFFYCGWRYWQRSTLRSVAALALALVTASLTKFTLLALIPMALVVVLWRGPRIAGAAFVLGASYLGILAAYQFHQVRPMQDDEFQKMAQEGFTRREIQAARILGKLPWPPQFIRGVRYIGAADRNQGFPAYMLGRRIEYAAPWYFPLAWAVKFPIALQLLALAGLAASVVRAARRQAGPADVFVWGPVALVMALILRSHIHIGFRHALPALPFVILGAGFALERWGSRHWAKLATVACLAWLAASSLRIYPQGLSYFNEWAGGPENGWKYLADSNLDWGQNLPELARYAAQRGAPPINLYYFGADVLGHYAPPEVIVHRAGPWSPEWEKELRLEPAPGEYAISLNALLGYFFSPAYRDYFGYFRARQPDARAGFSIYIYRVQ